MRLDHDLHGDRSSGRHRLHCPEHHLNVPEHLLVEAIAPVYCLSLGDRRVTTGCARSASGRCGSCAGCPSCGGRIGGLPETKPKNERDDPLADQRAFISFDFDHDEDLRNLLVGQSRNPDSPFSIQDWSLKDRLSGDWKAQVRQRIRRTDVTIVICGGHTNSATGVSAELDITRDEGNDYFLLWGRSSKTCRKPSSAWSTDKVYRWTWENLKSLIDGAR